MARVKDVGGPVGYGVRSCAASIIKLTKEQDYSVLSANDPHPELIEEQTLNMVSSSLTDNPATCERFESFNKGGCSACQFKGKIKSPIRIGVDSQIEDQDSKTSSIPESNLQSQISTDMLLEGTPIVSLNKVDWLYSGSEEMPYFNANAISRIKNFGLLEKLPFRKVCFSKQHSNYGMVVELLDGYEFLITHYTEDDTWTFAFSMTDDYEIAVLPEKCTLPKNRFYEHVNGYYHSQLFCDVTALQAILHTIHSGCEAKLCRITDKQKAINKKRIAKGKKPLYEETIIKIKPSIYYKPTGKRKQYTPTCAHQRRGHFRTLQSGKKVWVRDCKVSEGHERTVKHNYVFEYESV